MANLQKRILKKKVLLQILCFLGKSSPYSFQKNCQREKLSVPGLGNELELV